MVKRQVDLKFQAEGAEQVAGSIQRIGRASQQTASRTSRLASSARRAADATAAFGTKMLLLPTALVNVARIVTGLARSVRGLVFDLAKTGDKSADVQTAFAAMEKRIGSTGKLLELLRDATGETTDKLTLMTGVAKFAGAGIDLSAEQFGGLFSVIEQFSRVTGKDFISTLELVARSLAAGTPSALAQIGLLDEASARFLVAAEAGGEFAGTADTATKRTAIMNKILEGSRKALERLGGGTETAGKQIERFEASIADFIFDLKLGVATSQDLSDAFGEVTSVLQQFGIAGEEAGTTAGRAIGDALAVVIRFGLDTVEVMATAAAQLNRLAAEVVSATGSIVNFVTDAFAGLVQTIGNAMAFITRLVTTPLADILERIANFGDALGIISEQTARGLRVQVDAIRRLPGEIERGGREGARSARRWNSDLQTTLDGTTQALRENAEWWDQVQQKIQRGREVAQQRAISFAQLDVNIDVSARNARRDIENAAERVRTRTREVLTPLLEPISNAEQQIAAQAAMVATR